MKFGNFQSSNRAYTNPGQPPLRRDHWLSDLVKIVKTVHGEKNILLACHFEVQINAPKVTRHKKGANMYLISVWYHKTNVTYKTKYLLKH